MGVSSSMALAFSPGCDSYRGYFPTPSVYVGLGFPSMIGYVNTSPKYTVSTSLLLEESLSEVLYNTLSTCAIPSLEYTRRF